MDKDPIDKIDNDKDEEYTFTETEGASSYKPSTRETITGSAIAGSDNVGRHKKIFIIAGALIALFCLYKLYGLFSATPKKAPTTLSTSAAPKALPRVNNGDANTATQQTPLIEKNIGELMSTPSKTSEISSAEIKDKLTSLSQTADSHEKTIENLQQQITGLSTAIADIQNNLSMITQQVGQLTAQKSDKTTKKTAVSEKNIKASTNVTTTRARSYKKPAVYKANTSTNYYVKAIIQGRAWLVASDGATITVSDGDTLPGYGEIKAIDPDKGSVMTGSGRIITFMPQDK